ncbi:MAG: CCA tRNA nucleotidyltransferase [Chloroflexi bacterium]|nr:CCA tRNA nucleotidyltransferase [Chloroflexota bacterium]
MGGAVRDLLLGRETLDLDLVVEGNALALAEELAGRSGGRLTVHRRFGTAKWRFGGAIIDLVTSRSETYSRPGALPTVQPGPIEADLFRRDFTVNAMAAHLSPDRFGELVDPYHGRADLAQRLVRILHDRSFIDDATRILRALRYEQRLGFRLEPETRKLLRRDVAMLDTISGDRLRRELELILREALPERVLRRAEELGVLQQFHPTLKADNWLVSNFGRVRQIGQEDRPLMYLLVLAYRLTPSQAADFIARFRFPPGMARTINDLVDLRTHPGVASGSSVVPSALCRLLRRYSLHAIHAVSLVSESPAVRSRLRLYLTTLRHIAPLLSGKDILKLGLPAGPLVGEALSYLKDAVLDGKVATREEEKDFVRAWIEQEKKLNSF